MYMYYLLGYKIMELPISDERKEVGKTGQLVGGKVQKNTSTDGALPQRTQLDGRTGSYLKNYANGLFRLAQKTPSYLHWTGTLTSSLRRSSDLLT